MVDINEECDFCLEFHADDGTEPPCTGCIVTIIIKEQENNDSRK